MKFKTSPTLFTNPKMIILPALKLCASGIVLSHNHPSGNLKPSNEDIKLTKMIKEGAKLFEIVLLDHLIIVPDSEAFFSFADEGMI